jgi:methoxymalonate biosynthesis acyl carrier protein
MEEKILIRNFIMSNLVVFDEEANFTDDDNIFQKGFVNSLFAMKLLGHIEQTFKIKIDDDDMDLSNFSSVNRIMSLIDKKTLNN